MIEALSSANSSTKVHYQENVGRNIQKEFRAVEIASRLIEEGIIQDDNKGHLFVDYSRFNRAETIIDETDNQTDIVNSEGTNSYDNLEISEVQLEEVILSIESSLLNAGIVDEQTVNEIRERLFTSKNIEITEYGSSAVQYTKQYFPNHRVEAGRMIISKRTLEESIVDLLEHFKKAGVEISLDKLIDISVERMIGHEYGHILETFFVYKKVEKYKSDFLEDLIFERDTRRNQRFYDNAVHELYFREANMIAYDPDIELLSSSNISTMTSTTSERIATGIERIILNEALTHNGVSEENTNKILGNIDERMERKVNKWVEIARSLKEKNIGFVNLIGVINQLEGVLMQKSRRENSKQRTILGSEALGGRNLGYNFPLNKNQLKMLFNNSSISRTS